MSDRDDLSGDEIEAFATADNAEDGLGGPMSLDHEERPEREAPTHAELLRFAAGLLPGEADAPLARARPAPPAFTPEDILVS